MLNISKSKKIGKVKKWKDIIEEVKYALRVDEKTAKFWLDSKNGNKDADIKVVLTVLAKLESQKSYTTADYHKLYEVKKWYHKNEDITNRFNQKNKIIKVLPLLYYQENYQIKIDRLSERAREYCKNYVSKKGVYDGWLIKFWDTTNYEEGVDLYWKYFHDEFLFSNDKVICIICYKEIKERGKFTIHHQGLNGYKYDFKYLFYPRTEKQIILPIHKRCRGEKIHTKKTNIITSILKFEERKSIIFFPKFN